MKRHKLYIGIDPGKNGALAMITENKEVNLIDFDLKAYINLLNSFKNNIESYNIFIGIERVHSMPGEGVKSSFSFGERVGELKGMISTLNFDNNTEWILPQIWQKHINTDSNKGKKAIADSLLKQYPSADLFGPRGGLKDGRSDALGIANYIYQKYSKDKYAKPI
ncbi:hypothetical protein YZ82_01415 [Campylobacter hyointestinalis]|uniref:Uncharacterized protein n=1 Tax=Campylobacter hyointestinalis TaxID=198 RepID=A0A562XKE3_CAMHY|nr:hypothetical protein [Campylobacter hyointestinalis]TWO22601.1 hypothetical protein YZ82_01415 [Campylobacter hyointestinalis]